MRSFAAAELARLSGIQGVVAKRHQPSISGAGSAATDNLLEIKDGRVEGERVADAASIDGTTAAQVQRGRYGWNLYETEGVGVTYWSSQEVV
jgi:hypothetical protein